MKRLIVSLFTLLLLAAPQSGFAQSYTESLRKVEQAGYARKPKVAEKELQRLENIARKTRNTPLLIRVLCMQTAVAYYRSPARGKASIAALETELQKEKRPIERALWQCALGQMLVERNRGSDDECDVAAGLRGVELLLESVRPTELLGRTKATAYNLLIDQRKDSREVYGDDLLSVLTRVMFDKLDSRWTEQDLATEPCRQVLEILNRNIAYYQSKGMRKAALFTELDKIVFLPYEERQAALERIRKTYIDLPDNLLTYERLVAMTDYYGRKEDAVALRNDAIRRYRKPQLAAKHSPRKTQTSSAQRWPLRKEERSFSGWQRMFYFGLFIRSGTRLSDDLSGGGYAAWRERTNLHFLPLNLSPFPKK